MSGEYERRPWLGRYPRWVPHDLNPGIANGVELFRRAVAKGGDRPALHYFQNTLSHAELGQSSDALAAALVAEEIEPGDRVGVYLQNVPQYPIAMLAIWKLGAVMVCLSPMMKAGELNYQLKDSGARAVIAHESAVHVVAEAARQTEAHLTITTSELDFLGDNPIPEPLLTSSPHAPRAGRWGATHDLLDLVHRYAGKWTGGPAIQPDDIAMMVYTSGTTGRPKGAMCTHRNVVFNSEVYRTWMQLGDGDVILGGAPLFHVSGLVGHMGAALAAACPLVLFYRFDPETTLTMAERWRCTFTIMAITAFRSLLNHPGLSDFDLSRFTKLYSGGAPVSAATVESFEARTGLYIRNLYGLTETTSPSHIVPPTMRAPVEPETGAVSVGLPVPSTVVKIVDPETGAELPAGEPAELWTRGPGVVPGYWQRPEATAEAFTDGYLHTGDVGFMDRWGWFYVVDRAKDMINASGFKVWPREVEDQLLQHSEIAEVAVVGVPDAYRGETVKAFVVATRGAAPTSDDVITHAKRVMAAYKYPRQVEIVSELPKTETGKILRRDLRARTAEDRTESRETGPTRS
jgi:long-chain acyl-CoA synthetase